MMSPVRHFSLPNGGKSFFALLLCLSAATLSACAGAADWSCGNLPGNFEVWRFSANIVRLVLADENGVSASPVVPEYVFEVAYTDTHIFAKQADVIEKDDRVKVDQSNPHYYIVVVSSATCLGPYDEQTFLEQAKKLGIEGDIEWMDLDTLRKTPYEPQA